MPNPDNPEDELIVKQFNIAISTGDIKHIENRLSAQNQSKSSIPDYFSRGLITAAKHNQVEIIHLLVAHGCDVNFVDVNFVDVDKSMSPLRESIISKNMEAFKALLSFGADLNKLHCHNNERLKETPLKYAIINDNEMAKYLIYLGADVNHISKGYTPLTVSIQYLDAEITQLLIDRGANVNAIIPSISFKDGVEINSETSAIQVAASKLNLNPLKILIKNSADVNLKHLNAKSALMTAIRYSRSACAKLLIEGGANVNEIDPSGDTPLNNAILWRINSARSYEQDVINNTCIINLLIDAGADIKALNKDNLNALEQAKLVNIPEVVAKIENILLNAKTNQILNQANDLTLTKHHRLRL